MQLRDKWKPATVTAPSHAASGRDKSPTTEQPGCFSKHRFCTDWGDTQTTPEQTSRRANMRVDTIKPREAQKVMLAQPLPHPGSTAASGTPEKHFSCKPTATQMMGYNLSYGKLPDDHLSQDNSTSPNSTAGLLGNSTHNEFTTIVLPVLYLIIFLASILLNGLAVWIFFHIRNKTSFIFYLKNIVVADLLMTLTFPFKIIQDSQLGPWHFNSFLCRYTTVLFYTNMYTTIVFLGLISIDRYLKVVKPFGDSRMYSITFTKILSACVWVVMAFLALPNLILTNGYPTKRNIDDCLKLKSPLGVQWHMAVIYINTCLFVVVLIVLIGCYIAISRYIYKSSKQFISSSSRKRKHNQSIRVVVAVFFTCFLPYHLCRIPFTFSHLDKILDDSAHKILYYCKEMTLFLSACNVCLDPIIYFFMCRSFSRRLFRKSNMRTRSESIRSLQSVRRSEVRIYHEYTDV